jgi:hypothetical protein
MRVAVWILCLLASLLGSAPLFAQEESPFFPNASSPYTVEPGDTPERINAKLLRDARLWPHAWDNAAPAGTPLEVQPGDKIHFDPAQGEPHFRWESTQSIEADPVPPPDLPVVRVRPRIFTSDVKPVEDVALANHLQTLLRPYLIQHHQLTEVPFEGKGYIIASVGDRGGNLMPGDEVLIHYHPPVHPGDRIDIYRPGKVFRDIKGTKIMGIMARHLGTLEISRITPQGTVGRLLNAFQEIQAGDRLDWAQPTNLTFDIKTKIPYELCAPVIGIVDGLDEASANQIVVVGMGRQDKAIQGLVLDIHREGTEVIDPVTKKRVRLPDPSIARVVLYQIGERASYGLLFETLKSVHIGDWVGEKF